MKKLLSLLVCFLLTLSLVACGSNGDGDNKKAPSIKVDSSVKTGEPASVGDVFKLPDVKQATGAPVLAELTKQAYPGDSIIVSGEGFKSSGVKFYVYAQNNKDNGKAYEAKFTVVDDNYASVLIDEKLEYGMYGIYAENASGTSAVKLVNKPAIWDIGLYKLCAGESLTVLGENLTTDNGNKSHAFLVSEDGKEYCEAPITFADPGKIEITIPEGLKVGSKYKVRIHNGHGGNEGFAESVGMVEYLKETAIQFGGKVFDVTDYKADPTSRSNDDTEAIKKAIKEAQDGDTIYFPSGSYLVTEKILVAKSLRFLGAGANKTTVYCGYNVEDAAFEITGTPCEVTGFSFEQNRLKGKCKSNLLLFKGDNTETGAYKVYIHDNSFKQSVRPKSRSYKMPIAVFGTYGVRVENNYFDAFGVVSTYGSTKVFCKNNEALINLYVGIYYGSSSVFFTNTDFLDASNNKISGKGATEAGSGPLNNDEFTAGRVFVIQGYAKNTYISHNDIVRAGIVDTNAGEVILYEQYSYVYKGTVVSVDKDTIEVSSEKRNKVTAGSVITIINGKGRAQYRTITERKGNIFTLDRPWDIVPDSTSKIVVNRCFLNAMVCDNTIDGYTNWQEHPGSTIGLQAYGTIHNMFFCRNKMKNVVAACDVSTFYSHEETDDSAIAIIAWSNFDRNYTENAGGGMTCVMGVPVDEGEIPGEICFGNTFRRNDFNKLLDYTKTGWVGKGGDAIEIGSGGRLWRGNWAVANLFENNTFKDCARDRIILGPHQGKSILRNNTENGVKSAYKVGNGCNAPIETAY